MVLTENKEKNIGKNNVWKLQNLMKNVNLHIQETLPN